MNDTFHAHIHSIREFAKARNWEQFHTPKNLAMSIAIESAELMEIFQWEKDSMNGTCDAYMFGVKWESIRDELADVMIYALRMCDVLGINPDTAIIDKLEKNAAKYPVATTEF